jgi:2'-hydroxyisoflavone reductase
MWIDNTDPDALGFGTAKNARALAKGLTCRPVLDTAKDTLAWLATLSPEERAKVGDSGIKRDRELAVLAAWKARKTGT